MPSQSLGRTPTIFKAYAVLYGFLSARLWAQLESWSGMTLAKLARSKSPDGLLSSKYRAFHLYPALRAQGGCRYDCHTFR
jgi:hypothetical protein